MTTNDSQLNRVLFDGKMRGRVENMTHVHYHICRICKRAEYESGMSGVSSFPFIRYGVRHWAHADCGMKTHGMKFLQGLSTGQVERFPFMACVAAGLKEAIPTELNRRSQMQHVARETWKVPNKGEAEK